MHGVWKIQGKGKTKSDGGRNCKFYLRGHNLFHIGISITEHNWLLPPFTVCLPCCVKVIVLLNFHVISCVIVFIIRVPLMLCIQTFSELIRFSKFLGTRRFCIFALRICKYFGEICCNVLRWETCKLNISC